MAYASDESGRYEVYVRPFVATRGSKPSLGEAKWQVSKEGFGAVGEAPQLAPKWRNDGKEIVLRAPNGSPMAVDVSAKVAFEAFIELLVRGFDRDVAAEPCVAGAPDFPGASFNFTLNVSAIGPYAGTSNATVSASPAFTAIVDYSSTPPLYYAG